MDDLDVLNTIAMPEPMDFDGGIQDIDRDTESPLEEDPDITICAPDTGSPLVISPNNSDFNDSDSDSNIDPGETLHVQSPSDTDPEHRGQAGMFFCMSKSLALITTHQFTQINH
jgi:hypothetical protein